MNIMPGRVAVQLFFVISGFYMSMILTEKYLGKSILLFYSNRLLRLFPAYMAVILISLGILFFLDIGIFTSRQKIIRAFDSGPWVAATIVWANLGIIGQEILYLLKIDHSTSTFCWFLNTAGSEQAWTFLLVPQAWSLSMELSFYLLAPYIMHLSTRRVAIVLLMSVALRLFIELKGPEYDLLARRFFLAELCFFLTGVISYRLMNKVKESGKKRRTAGIVSLAVIVYAIFFYGTIDYPGSLGLLTLIAFLSIPFIFLLTKDSIFDRFFGKISYPIYIVHFLIVAVFEESLEEYSMFSLMAVVLFAALLVHFFIEKPIDKWRQSRVAESRQETPTGLKNRIGFEKAPCCGRVIC